MSRRQKPKVTFSETIPGTPHGFISIKGGPMTPTEARAIALDLLRAADLADPCAKEKLIADWYPCAAERMCPLLPAFKATGLFDEETQ